MAILFGAAPDTGNQGVTALAWCAVHGLARRGIGPVTVVDNARGRGRLHWRIAGETIAVERIGITPTRRLWRPEALATVAAASRLGGFANAAARAIAAAPAVLDVSGGDSFTDLYGQRRFEAITVPKELALRAGRPLVLLPQTIGPFRSPANRQRAARVLREATAVFTRDARSLCALETLLGESFDPARHRGGLDMAVLLPATAPRTALPGRIAALIAPDGPAGAGRLAGLNVSGLLFNDSPGAAARFGLAEPFPAVAEAMARALLLADPQLHLVLVPHVRVAHGRSESDGAACEALSARLGAHFPDRVAAVPDTLDASELKAVIARCAFFCGARMHATVAAFSSGVPTLGLAYSDKIDGVFEACGLAGAVADLRRLGAGAIAARASAAYAGRHTTAARLAGNLSGLRCRAEAQMDTIARIVAMAGQGGAAR